MVAMGVSIVGRGNRRKRQAQRQLKQQLEKQDKYEIGLELTPRDIKNILVMFEQVSNDIEPETQESMNWWCRTEDDDVQNLLLKLMILDEHLDQVQEMIKGGSGEPLPTYDEFKDVEEEKMEEVPL
jgi:hypothetical protein